MNCILRKKIPRLLLMALVPLFIVALPATASASVYVYNLSTAYSGTAPQGSPPWVTATFSDIAANTVQLTISGAGLTGSEFASGVYFNFNPSMNPSSLSFSGVPNGTTVGTGTNAFKADGGGYYDVLVNLPKAPPSSRFGSGSSLTMTITSSNPLNAGMFNYPSSPSGGNGTWYAAAHIQSISSNGGDGSSAWIGAKNGVAAPEPSTYIILGTMIGGIALWKLRASRTQNWKQF